MTWRLEVYVVDPARTGFRLDITPLNSTARLLTPPPGTLRLDAGTLDLDMLAPVTEPHIWLDLLPFATTVTARTSHRSDALNIAQEAGALSAPLIDPPDLPVLGVQRGTPIRLVNDASVKWWGWIDYATCSWDAETDRTTAHVTAYDVAGLWGSITRYGARSPGPETLRDRLVRLLASSPVPAAAPSWSTDDPIPLDGGSLVVQSGQLSPTVMETNLLAHIAMAAASCGLAVTARHPSSTADDGYLATLTLTDPTAHQAPAAHLHDAGDGIDYFTTAAFETNDPITVATVTTHGQNPDGSADDQTITVADPTATALFGDLEGALDLTVAPQLAEPIAARFLSLTRLPDMGPTTVTIRGAEDPGLACLDLIQVSRLGRSYTRRITGITHTLTPRPLDDPKHTITITLT